MLNIIQRCIWPMGLFCGWKNDKRHSWVWLTVPRLRFWLWRMTSFWAQTSESTVKTRHLSKGDTGAMGSYFSQLLSSRGFAHWIYRSFIIFQILYWPFWILVGNITAFLHSPKVLRLVFVGCITVVSSPTICPLKIPWHPIKMPLNPLASH